MALPPSGPLPEPVSWTWQDMEKRVIVYFDGPLQPGVLDPSRWGVVRNGYERAFLTVTAGTDRVTIQWAATGPPSGADRVSYSDTLGDLRAEDGRWLPAFTFYG